MFEPGIRSEGVPMVGQNIANPIAMLNASVDMLRYLGFFNYADAIADSICETIFIDKIHTEGN